MKRSPAFLLLAASLILFLPRGAEACTCRGSGPPCEEVWKSPLIFAGTVIEVDPAPGGHGVRRVRLKITEAFRGSEQGEIDIHLRGGGSASCDPSFKMGEDWLVYGFNRGEGGPGWTTSTCSRTRRLAAAAEDLAYLRIPDAEKPPSQISGSVTREVYPPSMDGGGRVYQVQFRSIDGFEFGGQPREVSLPHYLSCAVVHAGPIYNARVAGQVVDDAGLPVAFLPIMLVSAAPYLQRHTISDFAGRFEFPVNYPGPHTVRLSSELWHEPPDIAPISPTPLSIPPMGRVDAGRFRVPASVKLIPLEILIEDSAGKPAAGANVSFRQAGLFNTTSFDPSLKTDDRGAFRILAVPGERYQLIAFYTRQTPGGPVHDETLEIIQARDARPIRIRLAPFR